MISFCIPAFTGIDYIEQAVATLLSQPDDFELVVVDDFDLLPRDPATQRRVDAARALFGSDPRLRWVRSSERLPIQVNWNRTVGLATREYVKVMGADDRVAPGGVARMLALLRAEPAADFHGHLATIIDASGRVLRLQQPYFHGAGPMRVGADRALQLKLAQVARFKEPVCNVFRRRAWVAVGGYSEQFRYCFDLAFNVALMSSGPSCLWNEYLVELRRHERSDGALMPPDRALDELAHLVADIFSRIGPALTPADLHNGRGWLMYRTVELSCARFRGDPRQFLSFLRRNHHRLTADPRSLRVFIALLWRRVTTKDVQLTIRRQS